MKGSFAVVVVVVGNGVYTYGSQHSCEVYAGEVKEGKICGRGKHAVQSELRLPRATREPFLVDHRSDAMARWAKVRWRMV